MLFFGHDTHLFSDANQSPIYRLDRSMTVTDFTTKYISYSFFAHRIIFIPVKYMERRIFPLINDGQCGK